MCRAVPWGTQHNVRVLCSALMGVAVVPLWECLQGSLVEG